MEIYDTEEEQVAAIKSWWKENGTSTIVGVAIGLALITGFNFWQGHVKDQANQAAELYGQLQVSVNQENTESAEKIIEKLDQEYGSTTYASYAALMAAKLKVEQNDLATAKEILEQQMNNAASNELQHIARIRLVKLLHATGEYEQGLQIIAQVDPASNEVFAARYDELTGDLYVAFDRLGESRTAYQTALRSGAQSALLQFKLDDIAVAEVVVDQQ